MFQYINLLVAVQLFHDMISAYSRSIPHLLWWSDGGRDQDGDWCKIGWQIPLGNV